MQNVAVLLLRQFVSTVEKRASAFELELLPKRKVR